MAAAALLAVLYLAVAVAVSLVARAAVDPYGHFTPRRDWWQAVLIGVFWLPLLAWLIGVVVYYDLKG